MIIEIDYDDRTEEQLDEGTIKLINDAILETVSGFDLGAGFQISVSTVGDDEIRELNSTYRNNNSVTDVLSFPMEDVDARGVSLLGDVVICFDRAKAQAQEYGHSIAREISYLTVHSVLHLLGYDHISEQENAKMRAKEKEIMDRLGIYKREI